MYDSPFDYCPVCKKYIALDQALLDCAAKHHCSADACPLRKYFYAPEPPEDVGRVETNPR